MPVMGGRQSQTWSATIGRAGLSQTWDAIDGAVANLGRDHREAIGQSQT